MGVAKEVSNKRALGLISYLVEVKISRTNTASQIAVTRTSDPFAFSTVTSLCIDTIDRIAIIIFPMHGIDWPKNYKSNGGFDKNFLPVFRCIIFDCTTKRPSRIANPLHSLY